MITTVRYFGAKVDYHQSLYDGIQYFPDLKAKLLYVWVAARLAFPRAKKSNLTVIRSRNLLSGCFMDIPGYPRTPAPEAYLPGNASSVRPH
jgi:hypothetical protein